MAERHPERDIYLIKYHASGQPLHHGWHKDKFHEGPPAPNRRNFYPGENVKDANMGLLYRALQQNFTNGLKYLRQKGKQPTVRGILWMQGEMDAKHAVSAGAYAESLKRLKKRMEEDMATPPLPFVFGQVLPHEPALPRFTHRKEIRECQRQADESSGHKSAIPGVRMVSTGGYPLNADTVHYNAKGQEMLGKAFAEAMLKMQKKIKIVRNLRKIN